MNVTLNLKRGITLNFISGSFSSGLVYFVLKPWIYYIQSDVMRFISSTLLFRNLNRLAFVSFHVSNKPIVIEQDILPFFRDNFLICH